MTVADIRPPEDVPALRADILEPAHRLQTRGVWRHRWNDGTLRDVEVAAHSQTFVGRPARLVLALDVTDRLRAEGELRRTAELLKAVADGTTDAVFVKDRDGKYLLANPAGARFVGRADGDVLGRTDAELFDPDSARWVSERDRQVMTAGAAENVVEELTAAGVTRTYLATKAPYRDENGTVIGVIGISLSIIGAMELGPYHGSSSLRFSVTRCFLDATAIFRMTVRSVGTGMPFAKKSRQELAGVPSPWCRHNRHLHSQGPGSGPQTVERPRTTAPYFPSSFGLGQRGYE
jgi:PAS domain S-box-containing protein